MAPRDQEAVARFVERFALDLTASGMPRMPSRVFAVVLVTDSGSLTAGEIAERLRVSAASVSGAVRYLEQLGLLIRAREPGARRDHFLIDQDVWYHLYTSRDEMLVAWTDTLRDGVDLVGADTPAGLRLAETLAFFQFVHEELMALTKRWQERRAQLRREWGVE